MKRHKKPVCLGSAIRHVYRGELGMTLDISCHVANVHPQVCAVQKVRARPGSRHTETRISPKSKRWAININIRTYS